MLLVTCFGSLTIQSNDCVFHHGHVHSKQLNDREGQFWSLTIKTKADLYRYPLIDTPKYQRIILREKRPCPRRQHWPWPGRALKISILLLSGVFCLNPSPPQYCHKVSIHQKTWSSHLWQTCYFMGELYQLQASSPVTSRVYQTYSAVTGVVI